MKLDNNSISAANTKRTADTLSYTISSLGGGPLITDITIIKNDTKNNAKLIIV